MNPKLQPILQQAICAFENGNYESAHSILKRALQIDSKNFMSLHLLGLVKVSQLKHKEAIDYLARAARIQPNDASIHYNLAKALADSGSDLVALMHHKKAVTLAPGNSRAWLNYGLSASNLSRFDEAIDCYNKALFLNPDYAEAWSNKGVTLTQLKCFDEAIDCYNKALILNPDFAEVWFNKGNVFNELKRFDEAITHYDKALTLKPDYAEAWSNKGVTLNEIKRFDEAINCYDRALALKPDHIEAWSNGGNIFNELKRYDEAITYFDKALNLNPDFAEVWSNKGNVFNKLKRFDEAITHYDKALTLKPDYVEAWSNKGVVLYELKLFDEAIDCYEKALKINPEYAEAWSGKGVALHELKLIDKAIDCYDKTLDLKPDHAEAWSNKGNIFNELKRYDEAIIHFDKALSLKPDIDWVYGNLFFAKLQICRWSDLVKDAKEIAKKVFAKEKVSLPFPLLAMNDDPMLHKQAAETFVQDRYPPHSSLGLIPKYVKKDKIRIAYFSPDFRSHPVSLLTAELFEIHNRDKFEIFAFSLQEVSVTDKVNLRLRRTFDKFFDVEKISDKDIALLAREHEVDIAIDLCGHTQHSRTGIFSYRAAPIQVNWLGYPGTIGAKFIDYIIADRITIPESHYKFYVEKVVCLPNTYMVDDSKRIVSSRIFTREECGLPQNAFVFCCFNNNYKFNPQVLDSWSRILHEVQNSVLWISENNEDFKDNITAEFEGRGLDPSRLIFANKIELMEDHLARYALVDLFLDTYPYNAHTTTIDSLKGGAPVLTLISQSFAGRVAASLLNAIGLSELITYTQEEYEALAIKLATIPGKLADVRWKLANNRSKTALFDTPLFTKNLEDAYFKMYQRYQNDLPPDHISNN